MMLTQQDLRAALAYSPRTGIFRHKKAGSLRGVGDKAGYVDPRGFITIRVGGISYYAHRLAWLWTYGAWPSLQLDHRNRNKADNRIANLREATDSQNRMNSVKVLGASGLRGVSFFRPHGLWRARIKKDRRDIHLGYFEEKSAAHAAYCAARKQLFGEFCPS